MSQQFSGSVNSQTQSSGHSNAVFLLAGGLIGAAVGLLFAPKAGSELRTQVADVTKRGYDGALDLTSRVKDQAADLYSSVIEKGGGFLDGAKGSLSGSTGRSNEASQDLGQGSADVLSLPQDNGADSSSNKGTDIV
jgi:gas vesicle protein